MLHISYVLRLLRWVVSIAVWRSASDFCLWHHVCRIEQITFPPDSCNLTPSDGASSRACSVVPTLPIRVHWSLLYLQACITPLLVSARACHSAMAVRGEAGGEDAGRDRCRDSRAVPAKFATVPCRGSQAEGGCSKGPLYAPAYHAIRVDMSDRQVLSDSPGQPEQALISIRQPTSSFSGVAWLLPQSSRTHASTSHVSRPPAAFACMTSTSSQHSSGPGTSQELLHLDHTAGTVADCAARILSST